MKLNANSLIINTYTASVFERSQAMSWRQLLHHVQPSIHSLEYINQRAEGDHNKNDQLLPMTTLILKNTEQEMTNKKLY